MMSNGDIKKRMGMMKTQDAVLDEICKVQSKYVEVSPLAMLSPSMSPIVFAAPLRLLPVLLLPAICSVFACSATCSLLLPALVVVWCW